MGSFCRQIWRFALLVLLCTTLGGCRVPPPRQARQFVDPCARGGERVCLGRCAPAARAGEACAPGRNECAPGYRPCAEGLACRQLSTDPAAGVCATLTTPFCDPAAPAGSAENLCEDGLFCARYGTADEVARGLACVARPRLNLPEASLRGTCSRARMEGESCDSDWTRALQPLASGRQPACRACAPGLLCFNQVCRRPCRPEEGGLGSCIPDEQTTLFVNQWSCSPQAGRLTPSETTVTVPLCSVCVPSNATCELPPEQVPQTPSRLASFVCCDPNDVCLRTIDLTGSREEYRATCCGRPTMGIVDGGTCQNDDDCCAVIAPILGRVSRCCTSPDQPGCRPSTVGRCAGCGPGTGVPCCQPDGRGCAERQTCAGSGDSAFCVRCGDEGSSCCRRGNERTCQQGLTCFDRQGETPTGDRCLRCGSAGERCCPGSRCAAGHACVNGTCTLCGERDETCCDGRRCAARYLSCEGVGRGTCIQRCGAPGLQCCGDRGSIFGPPRPFCTDPRSFCDDAFMCRACGASGQPSCPSEPSCDLGLGIDPATGICGPCGDRNQACCIPGSAQTCGPTLACSPIERRCVPCGQYNRPCCQAEPRCVSDAEGTYCAGDGFCRRPPG